MQTRARHSLTQCQRLLIKVGSSILTHPNGQLHYGRLEQLARDIADILHEGRQVILVSSGAVAAGLGRIGRQGPVHQLAEKQALAAIGQGILMQAYEKLFSEYNVTVAQVLLTSRTLESAEGRGNAINTLQQLLDWRVLPIINENDTVATEEIRFGDNDTLAARVLELIGADVMIMLTQTDGVYTADPFNDSSAKRIDFIDELTSDVLARARDSHTPFGTGGMVTKLLAAQIAAQNGVPTVIASGQQPGVLRAILSGQEIGTLINAPASM